MMISDSGARRDEHIAFEELLPWYVTGRLAPDETARVEAHLAVCPACREELAAERDLRDAVVAAPLEPYAAWTRFRSGLEVARQGTSRRPLTRMRRTVAEVVARPGRFAALVAAQAAVVLVVVAVARPQTPAPAPTGYTVLGAAPSPATGNVMVVFRPDTTERQMRGTLLDVDAAFVGGPTPADAYVLLVPEADRAAALAALRAEPHVVLAEAIDAEPRR